ncbi:MAG TPA: TonB-dependent receptor plug domain-containing protein, partial [Longimicrobium sp.]|nr:TonB-dependent receptor plug domain-containing protein [Longimicrobium sp.]
MRTLAPVLLALAVAAARASAQQPCDSVPCSAGSGPGYLIVPTAQERASARDVSELLAGRAAGLYVRRTGGEVGAASRIHLRGPSHLSFGDRPLVVVDGVRAASAAVAPGLFAGVTATSPLDELDPEEVDSIRVLPGPAAAARYGPAAA